MGTYHGSKEEILTAPKYCTVKGLHNGRSKKNNKIQYIGTHVTKNVTAYVITKWPSCLINLNFNSTNSCLYNYWEVFYTITGAW
jgi:hypothetical protein